MCSIIASPAQPGVQPGSQPGVPLSKFPVNADIDYWKQGLQEKPGEQEMLAAQIDLLNITEHAINLGFAVKDGGLLPICSGCGKARMRNGTWITPEAPILVGMTRKLSHGICPECLVELYPELYPELCSEAV
jgi:hypothetical protein